MERLARCRVLVFAKAPIAGRVKTRLLPALGAEAVAALHRQLVRQTLAAAVEAGIGAVELWCAPSPDHPFFEACRAQFGVGLRDQRAGNLGQRMARALRSALRDSPYAIVIGSDCPALTPDDLRQAAAALQQGFDAVLGPAEDGGYVLLGLAGYAARLFENIAWGRASALAETRRRLGELRWRWHELPVRWDVDRPEDYARLLAEGTLPGWLHPISP